MKRTHVLVATSLVAFVGLMTGCAAAGSSSSGTSDGDSGGGSIAYIAKDLSQGWFQNEAGGVKKQATADGYTTLEMDSRGDANTQASNIDTALTQGAKGVVLVTADQKLGPAVVTRLKSADVPLVAVDDPIKDAEGNPVPFVGMATEEIGTSVGNLLADSATERGWAASEIAAAALTFDEIDVCKQRTDATTASLKSKLPDLPATNYFEANSTGNNTDGGLQAMQGLITAHPNIKYWLVYGCNEEGVVGAIRALEATGQGDTSCGVGLGDGALAKIEFGKGTPAYCGSVFANSAKHGETAVKLITDFLKNGTAIPTETLIPGTEVTVDNWEDVFGS